MLHLYPKVKQSLGIFFVVPGFQNRYQKYNIMTIVEPLNPICLNCLHFLYAINVSA